MKAWKDWAIAFLLLLLLADICIEDADGARTALRRKLFQEATAAKDVLMTRIVPRCGACLPPRVSCFICIHQSGRNQPTPCCQVARCLAVRGETP